MSTSNLHTDIGSCRQNVVVVCFVFAAVLKTGDYWAGGGGGGGCSYIVCVYVYSLHEGYRRDGGTPTRISLRRRKAKTDVDEMYAPEMEGQIWDLPIDQSNVVFM